MGGLKRVTITTALLVMALFPMLASVSPDVAEKRDSPVSVAMAQPLAADGGAIVAVTRQDRSKPALPESGMLVLVGAVLIGLASLVRRGSFDSHSQNQKSNVDGEK